MDFFAPEGQTKSWPPNRCLLRFYATNDDQASISWRGEPCEGPVESPRQPAAYAARLAWATQSFANRGIGGQVGGRRGRFGGQLGVFESSLDVGEFLRIEQTFFDHLLIVFKLLVARQRYALHRFIAPFLDPVNCPDSHAH